MRTALILLALLSLAACDDDDVDKGTDVQAVKVYASIEQCRKEQPADRCDAAFAGAEEEHVRSAPNYSAMGTCEAEYGQGNCVQRRGESGGDVFLPAMLGFMVGHALGSQPSYYPVYIDRSGYAYSGGEQIGGYRDCRNDSRCSSGGAYVYSGGGSSGARSSAIWSGKSVEVQTTTISRGGFGASISSAPTGIGGSSGMALAPGGVVRGGFGSTAAAVASAGE